MNRVVRTVGALLVLAAVGHASDRTSGGQPGPDSRAERLKAYGVVETSYSNAFTLKDFNPIPNTKYEIINHKILALCNHFGGNFLLSKPFPGTESVSVMVGVEYPGLKALENPTDTALENNEKEQIRAKFEAELAHAQKDLQDLALSQPSEREIDELEGRMMRLFERIGQSLECATLKGTDITVRVEQDKLLKKLASLGKVVIGSPMIMGVINRCNECPKDFVWCLGRNCFRSFDCSFRHIGPFIYPSLRLCLAAVKRYGPCSQVDKIEFPNLVGLSFGGWKLNSCFLPLELEKLMIGFFEPLMFYNLRCVSKNFYYLLAPLRINLCQGPEDNESVCQSARALATRYYVFWDEVDEFCSILQSKVEEELKGASLEFAQKAQDHAVKVCEAFKRDYYYKDYQES